MKNENYTPPSFVYPCREFLGGFDLDPFSSAYANVIIKAQTYFCQEDDGLSQDWSGYRKKWVNPPYSRDMISLCVDKVIKHAGEGETLLLVNTSSSARWYQLCLKNCSGLLFPSKRIQFYSPVADYKNRNLYDQTLFYFGSRSPQFAKALKGLGTPAMPFSEV